MSPLHHDLNLSIPNLVYTSFSLFFSPLSSPYFTPLPSLPLPSTSFLSLPMHSPSPISLSLPLSLFPLPHFLLSLFTSLLFYALLFFTLSFSLYLPFPLKSVCSAKQCEDFSCWTILIIFLLCFIGNTQLWNLSNPDYTSVPFTHGALRVNYKDVLNKFKFHSKSHNLFETDLVYTFSLELYPKTDIPYVEYMASIQDAGIKMYYWCQILYLHSNELRRLKSSHFSQYAIVKSSFHFWHILDQDDFSKMLKYTCTLAIIPNIII